MKRQAFQHPELRDANDNIIQEGTYGKTSPLVNSTNDGVLDYINNNLEALHDAQTAAGNAITTGGLTVSGKTSVPTANAGNSSKAIANTEYVQGELTNYLPLSGGTLTGVVNGVTPTAGDNSTKIATTEFVNAKAGNYLPLSGGTMTGNTLITMGNGESYVRNWADGLYFGGTYSDNASRLVLFTNSAAKGFQLEAGNGTTFKRLDGKPNGTLTWDGNNILTAANYNSYALPLSGGTMTGNTLITMGNGESYVRNWADGLYFGGTYSDNASRLVLFTNSAAKGFQLEAGNGTTFKRLDGKPDGTLTWDGNNILTAANYNSYALPLSGGTLTGAINTANNTWNKLGDDVLFGGHNVRGKMCIKSSQTNWVTGIAFFNNSDTNVGQVEVNNAFDFNKPVKENGGFLVPIGVVQAFAGKTIPSGWLLCDGSAVSRTTYAALFAVIGTTYGAGNGSTTFNLPNLIDKFVEGSATAGTVKSAGLPNITGKYHDPCVGQLGTQTNGVFKWNANPRDRNVPGGTDAGFGTLDFDASRSNSIYGKSTTVQPPALTMRYIIKY